MRVLLLSLFAIAALGIGVVLLQNTAPEQTPETQSSVAAAPQEQVAAAKPTALEAPRPANPKPTGSRKMIAENKEIFPDFKFRKELDEFSTLANKALLQPADRETKERLLKDRAFLLSLKPLLMQASSSEDEAQVQNDALDFLYDALKTEMHSEVVAIFNDILADSRIENASMDRTERTALAGIKAEVLYNWSALDPKAIPDIESKLPGPVSQKIWTNIKQQQDKNLAESEAIRAQQPKSF